MKYKPVPPVPPRKLPPPDAADRIRALAADGWSVRGIAAQLGIGQDLLRRWFDEDPALDEAMQRGREDERQTLHNVLYRAATEGTGKDSLIAAMFLLKARHGYREGDQQEQGNRVNVTFNIPAAMPLDKFMVVEDGHTDDRAERIPAAPARVTRGG
ncbi:MAG: hypothetical protein KAY46_03875 [Burkholderiaceae bacterium]|nr:hypothetical protein [Burkholderiaceae bacterium]MBP8306376.1 hypothetical protein [Burkholderiaceae bacterium]